mgnify:CR=1 FL=1
MVTPRVFPESNQHSTSAGPDFPGSSGDRERGKFRPSGTPRFTTVAVADDGGQPITRTTNELLEEILLWQKALTLAAVLRSQGAEFDLPDLF